MSSTLRGSRLIENCTPSISYDAQVQSASTAFDNQMWEIIDETGQIVMIPNIMALTDEKLVDILAWQFHVDFYDATRDLEFRKKLVQMSIIWHKTKGTVALVEEVLNTYWPGGASLSEWFEYRSPLPANYPTAPDWHDRYRFRVYVDQAVIPPADELAALALVDRYKPVSRWCDGIFYARVSAAAIGWAGAMLTFVTRESEEPDYDFETRIH
jgi:P2-related tail formation protein